MSARIDLQFFVKFKGPKGGWSKAEELAWFGAVVVDDEGMAKLGDADTQLGLQISTAQAMNQILASPDAVPRLADMLLERLKAAAE